MELFDRENLKGYLKEPYCREERQFAVFLYNIFLEKKRLKKDVDDEINEIVKNCLSGGKKENLEDLEDVEIEDVYFEVTLLRDCFYENRKEFNDRLLTFCLGGLGIGKELEEKLKKELIKSGLGCRNLGQTQSKKIINKRYSDIKNKEILEGKKEILEKVKEKNCLDIASKMMNAIPDILVIYKMNETYYAKMLECKYLFGENAYMDIMGSRCKMQRFIQECIMHFCFGKREETDESKCSKEFFTFPTSKKWKDKRDIWEKCCEEIYKNILNQEWLFHGIINAGVEIIRVQSPKNGKKKENEGEIGISAEKLLKMYL